MLFYDKYLREKWFCLQYCCFRIINYASYNKFIYEHCTTHILFKYMFVSNSWLKFEKILFNYFKWFIPSYHNPYHHHHRSLFHLTLFMHEYCNKTYSTKTEKKLKNENQKGNLYMLIFCASNCHTNSY